MFEMSVKFYLIRVHMYIRNKNIFWIFSASRNIFIILKILEWRMRIFLTNTMHKILSVISSIKRILCILRFEYNISFIEETYLGDIFLQTSLHIPPNPVGSKIFNSDL